LVAALFLTFDSVALCVLCSKVKSLGDSDDEFDSAAAWVVKSRQLEQDRRLAKQRVRSTWLQLF